MSHIVLGYELGTGYGHAAKLLPLARELGRRGHAVSFVVNDLARAQALFGSHGWPMYQAPLWMSKVVGLPPAVSYTGIMMRFGFLDPVGLLALARAWRSLAALLRPSLLVLDHSPAALFSTQALGIPRARFGTGFCCPPLARPMPPFAWGRTEERARLEWHDREVLNVANRVRADLGVSAADSVASLLAADQDFVCAFAATDHYPDRAAGDHWGPIIEPGEGERVAWPEGAGRKVFGYVRSEYPFVAQLVQALEAAGCSAILHVPGFAPAAAARLARARIVFSQRPVLLREVRAQCDLAVCHGGSSTVSEMLLAGKPLLLLPMQAEQGMMARRIESLGAALWAPPEKTPPAFGRLLERLLGETRFAQAARGFARAHAAYDPAQTAARIAARCEELACGR